MSQTETLLLFVLGFFACLFVVLLFGRGVFTVLGKWSGWRETRRVPTAIRELQAERDGLKAEKAMMAQKLEASITDMKMRMAEQMAEVSRNRNRLLDLSQTLKERESTISHLQTQLDDKSTQATSLQSQIEDNVKSINLAYAKMANRDEEHAKMQHVLKDAQSTLMSRDEKIRYLMDEVKALREMLTSNPVNGMVNFKSESQGNSFEAAPASLPLSILVSSNQLNSGYEISSANTNGNNPLMDGITTDQRDASQRTANPQDYRETDKVDRSVSNVLSLAERVRNLNPGMKKA